MSNETAASRSKGSHVFSWGRLKEMLRPSEEMAGHRFSHWNRASGKDGQPTVYTESLRLVINVVTVFTGIMGAILAAAFAAGHLGFGGLSSVGLIVANGWSPPDIGVAAALREIRVAVSRW